MFKNKEWHCPVCGEVYERANGNEYQKHLEIHYQEADLKKFYGQETNEKNEKDG